MRFIVASLLALALGTIALAAPTPPRMLVVSPNGKDTHPGTMAAPFATLDRARDAIRSMKRNNRLPKSGVVVRVRPGMSTT